jgi:amidase
MIGYYLKGAVIMTHSDLALIDANGLRVMIDRREVSATELLRACISNYEKYNGTLCAIVTANLEGAIEDAARFDEAQNHTGLLAGLPIAVKDVFATTGIRTTYGNNHFVDNISSNDEILVEREKAAGAIILGKSNTPDCAASGITENTIFGRTLNPWNLEQTTSGSGGGGVSALASGMVTIADGSDVGGSVRSPAAWTNLVGFRPSSGRIPGLPGTIADGGTSTAGVFAHCVKDAAMFVEAVEGPDNRCAVTCPRGEPINYLDVEKSPKDLPVAWMDDFASADIDDEIRTQFNDHARVLANGAAIISHQNFDPGDQYRTLYADFNAYASILGLPKVVLDDCLEERPVFASIKRHFDRFRAMTPMQISEMFRARDLLKTKLQDFMDNFPVLAQPVHAGLAFNSGDYSAERNWDWAALYLSPMLGLPSICIPLGFTRDGMPHGILFTGRPGDDQMLLKTAHAFERETGYRKFTPTSHIAEG